MKEAVFIEFPLIDIFYLQEHSFSKMCQQKIYIQ